MNDGDEDQLANDEGETTMMPGHPMYFMGEGEDTEGLTARAGEALPKGTPLANREKIEEALRSVYDPEIPVNIYDLGLIYEIDQKDDGAVSLLMTLTAPACPVAGEMPYQVAEAVAKTDGVGEVEVTLTWDPPWDKERMTEDARLALGIF